MAVLPAHLAMTESSRAVRAEGAAKGAVLHAYWLSPQVTLRDADQEVALTLATLGCDFDRCETGGVVTYAIRQDSIAFGRLVILGPTRVFRRVRVREVHLDPEFQVLCQPIRRDLESLSWAVERVDAEESSHYSYPRPKRRQIVEEYRMARRNGEVENKQAWAERRYHISRKTLWRYEREFPEEEASLPGSNSPDD